jgi:hypothetical protein
MKSQKSEKPTLIDTGESLIAAVPGPKGSSVTITDAESISEIRALIVERQKLGEAITKKLLDRGLHTASEEKTVVIPPGN